MSHHPKLISGGGSGNFNQTAVFDFKVNSFKPEGNKANNEMVSSSYSAHVREITLPFCYGVGGAPWCVCSYKLHSPLTNRQMELGLHELTVFLLVAVAPTLCVPPGSPCPSPPGMNSTCVCQTPYGVVDLRSVASRNGTAR